MNKSVAVLAVLLLCFSAILAHRDGGHYGGHGHGHGPGYDHGHGHGDGNGQGGGSGTGSGSTSVKPDTRTLDTLYKNALAEGGKLVIYAGGDAPTQQDSTKAAFEKDFPGMTVEMIVDFSKYHDARIDYQLATNSVVVDLTQLQTLQDFPKWRDEGVLLNYKPIDWDRIYDEFKDQDGAYTAIRIIAFSTNVNTALLPNNKSWPIEANDYLKPELKNKLVITYPNDDDAVLFWFKQVVDKYGFEYLDKLKAQNPTFVRGTQASAMAVRAGPYVATMSSSGSLNSANPKFILPKEDPFVIWPQTAAIFKDAPHPEAAKLYMSWAVAKKNQASGWAVRNDIIPPAPYKSVWSYPNGDPTAFLEFMTDRAAVETFKTQITLVFGQVEGPSPNGDLDMHPVKGHA